MSVNPPPPPHWNISQPVPTATPLTAEQKAARDAEWEANSIAQEAVERNMTMPQLMATELFLDRKPDLTLLKSGGPPAPHLPFGSFGSFDRLLEDLAQEVSAPVDYVAFSLLTCAAAMMGNSCSVMPDPRRSNWVEPVGLWTCLVGLPSSGKSPAMRMFTKILDKIETDDLAAYRPEIEAAEEKRREAQALLDDWHTAKAAAKHKGEAPPDKPLEAVMPPKALAPRTYTTDATIEAMAELLSNNANGILLYRDELAGWLGDMSRYSKSSDRPTWLTLYSGGTLKVDRVKNSGEPVIVEQALVSVMGAMQPDRLAKFLAEPDDGLIARMLFVAPSAAQLIRPVGRTDMAKLEAVFDRLRIFKAQRPPIGFSPEAADLFFKFRQYTRKVEAEASGPLLGWIGKGNGVVARLSAILTNLDWAYRGENTLPPYVVEYDAVKRASELWADYLLPMARRAFGDAARPAIEKRACTLLKEIRKRVAVGHPLINARTIHREWHLEGMREAKPLGEVLSYLHEGGWLALKVTQDDIAKGRRRGDWYVNPKLWEP